MRTILHDVRFALRQMRRTPGFVAVAMLTLALGIGATTAIFTLVYQVILRSLPVSHPEQLYKLGKSNDCCVSGGLQLPSWNLYSYDLYRNLRDNTPGTDGIAAVSARVFTLTARLPGSTDAGQPLGVEMVSGNYFPVLGVRPFTGRLLRPEDDRPGAPPVAVMSYSLWQTKFAGDPRLVGGALLLSGHPVTIVGITAPNFLSERNRPDPPGLALPLMQQAVFDPDQRLSDQPGMHWLDVMLRIPDARRVPEVQTALQTGLHRWLEAHLSTVQGASPASVRKATLTVASANNGINDLRDSYQDNLHLLLLVAAFVLLIACANLANLLLVRGMARQGELAMRTALGAPRSRLIRQTLVEALVLAVCGGALGLLLAFLGTHAILALAFRGTTVSPLSASPSLPVLGFAFLLSVLTGLIFGIAPAWITSQTGPAEAIRGTGRSTSDRSATPQKALVILQAALSLALLSTAGLLISSLRRLEHQDFHFQTQGRLIVATDLSAAGYTAAKLPGLYQQIDNIFSSLPSVMHFAYATYGPMTGNSWGTGVWFPGGSDRARSSGYSFVSADYFTTLGTQVLAGRSFSRSDTATSEHVAIVNKAFAQQLMKGKLPVGQHFGPDSTMPNEYEVVGVVEDAKYGDPTVPAGPMFFLPITQTTVFPDEQSRTVEAAAHFASNLIVQYRGDSAAAANQVRSALRSISPDIPILSLQNYQQQMGDNFTQQDLVMRLTALFGLLALVLAAIGLYGVTAYSVARRTRDIGVRMALGASRRGVLTLILRGALLQAGMGLLLGVPLSLLAGKLLAHSLYQTGAVQPLVLGTVAVLLLIAAALAAAVPAFRASAIDPARALRSN